MVKRYLQSTVVVLTLGSIPAFAKHNDSHLVIGLVGDVILGRLVNKKIEHTSYTYPWGTMKPLLESNDINISNLETALTTQEYPRKGLYFKATPDKAQTLKEGSIHVANLANNHVMDFLEKGLGETIQALDAHAIKHVGAGIGDEAHKPVIIEKKGIKIGILGYTDTEPAGAAKAQVLGVNYLHVENTDRIKKDIQQLKKQVDHVIVSIHWGPNFADKPSAAIEKLAHAFVDAGASIVHGHSAHVLQAIEVYKGKLILYNTGDFISDFQFAPVHNNDWTSLFQVKVSKKKLLSLQIIPAVITHMQVNRAFGKQRAAILNKITTCSAAYNTFVSARGTVVFDKKGF
jgi:poly-gamma-glutamate capsule biosynthesis protein CapA/YwtB (metallophosphatase superfamily)